MGRKVWSSTTQLSESCAQLAHDAVAALEVAYDCELLAFIAQDEKGVYVTLRPGAERIVAENLYDLNWTAVFTEALRQYPA